MKPIVPNEIILKKIYMIRNEKVMLDRDLADLYEVQTKVLKQAVRRNIDRFPEDFMFELTRNEFDHLRSQIVTSSHGGARYLPMVFTEQGIAMLSSVLKSDKAIQMNIQIIRIFTKIRKLVLENVNIKKELDDFKNQTEERFNIIFQTLDQLIAIDETPTKKIGF